METKFVNMNAVAVELFYANSKDQKIYKLGYKENTSIQEFIELSGVLIDFPEIDLSKQPVGVYGEIMELDCIVNPGCRIEIYRHLSINPKEARRVRAKEKHRK